MATGTPHVRNRAIEGFCFDGEGGAVAAANAVRTCDVRKFDCRLVHGDGHALGVGFGAGLIAFAHRSRGRYNISGIAGGRYRNVISSLLVVPYVGHGAVGVGGNGGNAECCAATITNSGLASNVAQNNRR